MKRKRILSWCVAALATFAIVSCGQKSGGKLSAELGEAVGGAGTLDPKPSNPNTIEAQLARYEGQTKYLNWHTSTYRGNDFAAPKAAMGAPEGALQSGALPREIKFSDVYAFGPEGEKTLILLNNVGGLQIVSYDAGAKKPELVGEVEATYNNPEDMYFDAESKRAYVLETMWYDESGQYGWGRERNTKLHVYNVEDPKAPFLSKTIDIRGELADSRMVGNKEVGQVLYVVTSEYPYNWWNATSVQGNQGHVFAYRLDGDEVTLANDRGYTLSKRVSTWRRNMNITQDGADKFYLTAVLEGGWSQPHEIEVLDISDPKGSVSHVMTVSPRGQLSERTSTMVKNQTLITVSSFRPNATPERPWEGEGHIAVETFNFPGENPQIITKTKAERNLAWIRNGVAEGGNYRELVSNEVFGLKGLFVKTDIREWGQQATFKLHKLVADNEFVIEPKLRTPQPGQPVERDALLHDVRVSSDGSRLYVFWVPGRTDPLDVFDISEVEKTLVHVGHTEFEGWVERAFPVTFNKTNYVIGLGRAGTGNVRAPQVTLFKINELVTQEGEKKVLSVEAPIVASLNLEGQGLYVEFNTREDKYIAEPKITAEGKGAILFQISQVKQGETYQYFSGGQLIGVDLSKAPVGRDNRKVEGVFWQGALLATTSGDALRRTFENTKIENGFNTFSDRELGTYIVEGAGKAGEPVRAESVLELTRTVKAYTTLKSGDKALGVQIVADEAVELRVVPPTHADQRKPVEGGPATLKLAGGNYAHHLVAEDGSLLVLTTRVEYRKPEEQPATGRNSVVRPPRSPRVQILTVSKAALEGHALVLKSATSWEKPLPDFWWGGPIAFSSRMVMPWFDTTSQPRLVELKSKQLVVTDGESLRLVELVGRNGVSFPVSTASCTPKTSERDSTARQDTGGENARRGPAYTPVTVETLGGTLYASFAELVEDPTREVVRAEWPTSPIRPLGTTVVPPGGERPITRPVEPKKVREKLKFERRYLAVAEFGALTEKGERPLVCQTPVNVPGKIVAVVPGKKAAIFEDGRVADIRQIRDGEWVSYQPVLRTALVTTKLEDKSAPLASLYDPGAVSLASMQRVDEASFAHVESEGYGAPVLALLAVDDSLQFRKQWRELPVTLSAEHDPQLVAVVRDPRRDRRRRDGDEVKVTKEAFLAVVMAGRRAQIVGFSRDGESKRLDANVTLKKAAPVSLKGQILKDKSTDTFTLFTSGIYWWGYRGPRESAIASHFTASQRSFEFSLEQFGVRQLFIEN